MTAALIALIGTAASVVAGLIGAAVNSWLSGREKVAEELRELRLRVYPSVWKRTSVISRWPRTDATHAHIARLHVDLRAWYYEVGGLYLSENARARYGDLQELLEVRLETENDPLKDKIYKDLMDAASDFRTALTEDLQSRQQRSLLSSIRLGRLHGKQRADAKRRIAGAEPTYKKRHHIGEAEEQLEIPGDPSSAR